MRRHEAEKWVDDHHPTCDDLLDLIDAADATGMSKVNRSIPRAKALEILRAGVEKTLELKGAEYRYTRSDSRFLIARNVVWECLSKPRKG